MKLALVSVILNLALFAVIAIGYASSKKLQKSPTVENYLFPKLTPYEENYLQVSQIHRIWYAQYGNPQGEPVVLLHGGPGAGSGDNDMRFFDPKYYRIILLDQRGAKRSEPAAEMRENTTQHLIADIEALRQQLKIEKWLVFGGSWGSALSLAYGQAHPERCLGFILRGIFLGRKAEGDQLWYGMKDAFPEVWEEFVNFLPVEERDDLPGSYYKRLMHPDRNINYPAARAFIKYDFTSAFLQAEPAAIQALMDDEKASLGMAKTFTHYYMHDFFFKPNELIDNLDKVNHLPLIIVHGRYDIICRAQVAYELHKKWPNSKLVIVEAAGHSAREPGITKALVEATESMKQRKNAS